MHCTEHISTHVGCMAALQAEHFLQEVKGMEPNTATHWGTEADAKIEVAVNGSLHSKQK